MKLFMRGLIALTTGFACTHVSAQQLKPSFNEAANRIEVSIAEIQDAFLLSPGSTASFRKGAEGAIEGIVSRSEIPSARFATLIIRSADASAIQLNRISEPGSEIFYTGRINNINGEYGYVLKHSADGYFLEKFKTSDVLQMCSK